MARRALLFQLTAPDLFDTPPIPALLPLTKCRANTANEPKRGGGASRLSSVAATVMAAATATAAVSGTSSSSGAVRRKRTVALAAPAVPVGRPIVVFARRRRRGLRSRPRFFVEPVEPTSAVLRISLRPVNRPCAAVAVAVRVTPAAAGEIPH